MGVVMQLVSQPKELGEGLTVRRLLPSPQRQGIGPFLFLDHFGPYEVMPGRERESASHPHIGIATITYLFDGALVHRDSLERVQAIEAGSVNWLTAGCGIVHSERQPEALQDMRYVKHGVQLWAALPQAHEEAEPEFCHVPSQEVPTATINGVQVRVLAGSAFGHTSPAQLLTPAVLLDVMMPADTVFEVPDLATELGVYTVDGAVQLGDEAIPAQHLPAHQLALLAPGMGHRIVSTKACRLLILGGEPLDAPRYMWWNFVSSRKERVAKAAQEWSAHAFGYSVGDSGIMALPDRRGRADRRNNTRVQDRRS